MIDDQAAQEVLSTYGAATRGDKLAFAKAVVVRVAISIRLGVIALKEDN